MGLYITYKRTLKGLPYRSIPELFWDKVDKSAGPDGCWPFKASRMSNGYGSFRVVRGGITFATTAHRFAHLLSKGPIPDDMVVCHTCDYRPCCNPAHLVADTQNENMKDCVRKGRTNREERHHETKIKAHQAIEIRRLALSGRKHIEIAKSFGVSITQVSNIRRGITWRRLWK